jgi:hypothetical protein
MERERETKKHHLATTTLTVGVVSSIKLDKKFKDYFEQAFNANAVLPANTVYQVKYQEKIGYSQTALQNAISYFGPGGNLPAVLVVTVGGLVAFSAADANSFAQVKFISMVGAVPTPINKNCYGGVSLESFAHNQDRVAYLLTKNFATISLFCNQYSQMNSAEETAWSTLAQNTPQLVAKPIHAMVSAASNSADYLKTVPNITSSAVIISADPYLQSTKDDLVSALNTLTKAYVCYPAYNYKDASTAPTSNNATLYGPRLEWCITTLGQMAALVLNSQTNLGFLKEPLGDAQDL